MQNRNETKSISDLAKFIFDNGYEKTGNGSDKRVLALLNSLARKPDNLRHKRLLWRIVMPGMIERSLAGNSLMPYPDEEEFKGEIEMGFVGIYESFSREEFQNAGSEACNS